MTKPEAPIFLRALESDDVERTFRWHNDPKLYATLGGTFRYVSRRTEAEWLESVSRSSQDRIALAVCRTGDSQHIGNIYLRDIDWVSRHGEVHVFIDPKVHGQGLGRSAVEALVHYAFSTLGLVRLYLYVLHDNVAAIRLYERCGFILEGRLRHHTWKDGAWKDMIVMGLLVV